MPLCTICEGLSLGSTGETMKNDMIYKHMYYSCLFTSMRNAEIHVRDFNECGGASACLHLNI